MKHILLTFFLVYSVVGFTQQNEALSVDSTWFKETFEFPLSFAKGITHKGFADLRFAPGFTKAESPELWSYVWAWHLNGNKQLTANEIEHDVQLYFDGLLGLDPKYHKDVKLQTTAVFIKKVALDGSFKYIGKVKTFDTRYTKKPLTLNVHIESTYCKEKDVTLLVFRYSSQHFGHDVWNKLKQVQLKEEICN